MSLVRGRDGVRVRGGVRVRVGVRVRDKVRASVRVKVWDAAGVEVEVRASLRVRARHRDHLALPPCRARPWIANPTSGPNPGSPSLALTLAYA